MCRIEAVRGTILVASVTLAGRKNFVHSHRFSAHPGNRCDRRHPHPDPGRRRSRTTRPKRRRRNLGTRPQQALGTGTRIKQVSASASQHFSTLRPSRALTEPLGVLYRGCVARDRRGCDHGPPGGAGALVFCYNFTLPRPAPPASLPRPGGPFRHIEAPVLRSAPLRCPKLFAAGAAFSEIRLEGLGEVSTVPLVAARMTAIRIREGRSLPCYTP
jgi:hypothetical protein